MWLTIKCKVRLHFTKDIIRANSVPTEVHIYQWSPYSCYYNSEKDIKKKQKKNCSVFSVSLVSCSWSQPICACKETHTGTNRMRAHVARLILICINSLIHSVQGFSSVCVVKMGEQGCVSMSTDYFFSGNADLNYDPRVKLDHWLLLWNLEINSWTYDYLFNLNHSPRSLLSY